MKNIYGKTNRYKTKESRYFLLSLYKKRLQKLLREGYNPFEDNTAYHIKKINGTTSKALDKPKTTKGELKEDKAVSEEKPKQESVKQKLTIKDALGYALKLKTNG